MKELHYQIFFLHFFGVKSNGSSRKYVDFSKKDHGTSANKPNFINKYLAHPPII